MLLFLQKKKQPSFTSGTSLGLPVKCPFCVFGEMDSTKRCGSDNFIGSAFLSASPSIGRLTEAMSLKMQTCSYFTEKKYAETTDP